jgi:hypothetical protein
MKAKTAFQLSHSHDDYELWDTDSKGKVTSSGQLHSPAPQTVRDFRRARRRVDWHAGSAMGRTGGGLGS